MGTIGNGKNTPLNLQMGTVPNVGGAMLDWFQTMVFTRVVKTVVGFQVVETLTDTTFRGVIQPLQGRKLELKPEGQRAWTWLWLHADPSLTLDVDEIVFYNGVRTRIMSQKNYTIYGYVEYELVQDWEPILSVDGGDNATPDQTEELDGGDSADPDQTESIDGGSASE